ncbi:glyoxylate/hydroxypyruvate reductase A [Ahrensia sp. R2A130]|uniref:2-hydroxyacid dehydrogenase n=1 Tax=Ahrensia sp. R2A130 TaxID=744979 RepID=UPI0001E0E08E|nr:glyoxylate/hydroxypyruvate reductase A [Ahrensia sp. R2A130]EFL89836.1 glyoxylate/hydroxypyruvate reductase A [Ahrensia sp. R2A130]
MNAGSILLAGALSDAERDLFTAEFGNAITDIPSSDVRFAVVWKPALGLLAQLPALEAIFSLGAGVDHVLRDPNLPDVPLVRFVDPDLTGRMMEWVVLQCLMHLRRQREFDVLQHSHEWNQLDMPTAREVTVGIMGLGTLGVACAQALRALHFNVRGLVRTAKDVPGVEIFATDREDEFLAGTDMLVNLLPLTDDTRGMIDAALIKRLRSDGPLGGPLIINAGRGGSQVESDIADALRTETLAGVSLDVFEVEPLSADSPLWDFENAILTPHMAAATDPSALVAHVRRQIERVERGESLEHVVDRARGY